MRCATPPSPPRAPPSPQVLESPLEKKAGINFGPPGTKQLIYFVDDLNMPRLDAYETAMPISLIRQHLAWGHWYDRAKLTQKNIGSTQYVAAMNPSAGSFVVNPRLQRLFMTLAVDFPGQDSLMKIYGTFLTVRWGASGRRRQEQRLRAMHACIAAAASACVRHAPAPGEELRRRPRSHPAI